MQSHDLASELARALRGFDPRRILLLAALLLAAVFLGAHPTAAQGINKFEQLGCYKNPGDNRIWLAALAMTDPKYRDPSFYDDPNNPFAAIIKAGDHRFPVKGDDILIHPLDSFDFAGAEKYQFMRFSLVIDYSSSIPADVRTDVVNFVSEFVEKLPLAVDGQVIRFSSNVEVGPFTNKKADLQAAIRGPIQYDLTALHDALMDAASSLSQQGGQSPVRVIILVTDGYDTASKNYTDRQTFIQSFTSIVKQERIAVLAIGVTGERDEELMNAITNRSAGIAGFYKPITDFSELRSALTLFQSQIRNTVIFRFPSLGPSHGQLEIAIGNETKGGNFNTIQTFNCQF